jgi:BirA family biotin operon repressor/biotin-[acetyl-CoA-carboxylase] ligase
MRVVRLDETASTNTLCAELGLSGAETGLAVVARRQTAGRGRLGRVWHTPDGDNLFLSILHRSRLPSYHLAGLTLDVGVTLCSVLEGLGLRPTLKWPNDVLLDGRKVAGVLCELHEAGGVFVVIGVGLNVQAQKFPAEISATSLACAGVEVPFAAVESDVIAAVRQAAEAYEMRGRPDIDAWLRHTDMVGRAMVASEGRRGVVTGLAPDGALFIRWDGEAAPTPFIAGELLPDIPPGAKP